MLIKGRNSGANITLLDTIFQRLKDPNTGSFREVLTIIYKDCDTGYKYFEDIIDPDYEYFIAKPNDRVNYPRMYIDKRNVDSFKVKHRDLEKDIASRLGLKEFYYENIRNGNMSENKKIHLHPDVFNSDMNIEDHYRYRFDKEYKNEPFIPTKAYFDIEADTIHMVGDFPELGECPINAISLITESEKIIDVFLLRTKGNPQIAEFEKECVSGSIFGEFQQFLIDYVGEGLINKYELQFNLRFHFYDEDKEIDLISDLFAAINYYKPDFALAWNMSFDIPYIIERIKNLGFDPKNIMCHPDFRFKCASYYIDERNRNEFEERCDEARIASYTSYQDPMIHFASRRKNESKFISYSLDSIGEDIAKMHKLDYKHITTNIAELPYKDYKIFVFYNIIDTIVMKGIEHVAEDINYIFNKCNLNNTRYSKCHRQTVYLTNRGIKFFNSKGFIMGNNVNKYNPKPTEKFPGAFVADMSKINNYSRFKIYGKFVDIFDNLIDFDYSSLYPSIIRQFNIAPYTQIGKLNIPNKVHDRENIGLLKYWTRESMFMEDMSSQIWLEICTRWFNLANYTELYNEVQEFFTNIMEPYYGIRSYDKSGLIIPIINIKSEMYKQAIIPIENDWNIPDVYIPHDEDKWERWRENAIANPNQQFGAIFN